MATGDDESVFRNRLHSINNAADFDKNLPSPVRWPAARAPPQPAFAPYSPALSRSFFCPFQGACAAQPQREPHTSIYNPNYLHGYSK